MRRQCGRKCFGIGGKDHAVGQLLGRLGVSGQQHAQNRAAVGQNRAAGIAGQRRKGQAGQTGLIVQTGKLFNRAKGDDGGRQLVLIGIARQRHPRAQTWR